MDLKLCIEILILIIGVSLLAFYISWQIKKNGLRKVAVSLIVDAEENFKNNYDRFNYCVDQLLKMIPVPFSFFITDEMVCKFVQTTFDLVKKALDYREGE